MKKIGAVLLGIVLLAGLFPLCSVQAKAKESSRVLFISSYSYAWDTVQIQIEGIKKGIGEGTVLDYEFCGLIVV